MSKLLAILTVLLATVTLSAYADDAPATDFTLNTTAFLDAGALPVLYTCDGKDLSPELDWTNVPAKTQSLAIIVTDPDAPGGMFYHWVVYNISTSVKTLDEGVSKLPEGAMVGKNSFGKLQYNGPCPPKGSAHTYTITLYALDDKLDLPAGADGKTVEDTLQKHIIKKVTLTMTYSRWLK